MTTAAAALSGTFSIGGQIAVNRLGFGAMRLAGGAEIWGEPADRDECVRLLQRLPELGVNFIDTADCYGPHVSELLLGEAFARDATPVIATKGGMTHPAPDKWGLNGDPAYLREQALESARRLRVDRIDLWQLHRIDPAVPRRAQFEAIASMIEDGIIRCAGLSEVSVVDIQEAEEYFPVATVQNRYNIAERAAEDVLEYCEAGGIGFIPYFPLGNGSLTRAGSALSDIAETHGATPGQIALAWSLRRSSAILPIPGTSKVRHLEQNVAAASIRLSDSDYQTLDAVGRKKRDARHS